MMTDARVAPAGANKLIVLWAIDSLFSRNIWRGVMAYIRPAKPWFLRLVSPLSPIPPNTSGVIACLDSKLQFRRLKKLGIPALSVADNFQTPGLALVSMDNVAIGRMGARHLWDNGYRNFVFAGLEHKWSAQRLEGFREELAEYGSKCEYVDVSDWIENRRGAKPPPLQKLLAGLKPPVAIMACNDWVLWRISELCNQRGGGVLDGIALLGVDNDEIICESLVPPASSIIAPSENVGYQAAVLLDGLMNGEPPPDQTVLVPPSGIATRASTDPFANADKDVLAAIRFIRERAESAVNVDDILKEVPVSRRSLERKFKTIVGRTPLEEIGRIRIEQAQHLLLRTHLPLATVARRSGFSNAKRFSTVFKQKTGMSPSEYRTQMSPQNEK